MTDPRTCTSCGLVLPASAADGTCPKCLLKLGLEEAAGNGQLHVRCPHCHNPIELVDETPLKEITCPSCDSKFSLVGDVTTTAPRDQSTKIGQFELLEQVGVGGFGTVWKARDTELDRTVAVKIPRRDQISPTDIEQFLREARAAAQLVHPNIVSVHEVGRSDNHVYIVSDFVDGVTLADWLSAHQMSPREAAGLCAHLADALEHAHQSGVVHRDLKPSNIMVDSRGEPHIMDFGLAKRDAGEITMTIKGKVLGTPAYMSPEQASGKGHDADARSDVYSLGVILFEMLTGEKPFRGTSRMLLHQVIHDDAPSPRKLNGIVPRDLETICLKCMEKEPERRYQSANEVEDELRRFMGGESITARPVSRLEQTWRWCRRNPLLASMSAAVIALLVIVAIGSYVSSLSLVVAYQEAKHNLQMAEDAEHLATREAKRLRWRSYVAEMNLAQRAWSAGNITRVRSLLQGQIPRRGENDLRGFEWYHLLHNCRPVWQTPTIDHGIPVWGIAYSHDGTLFASTGAAGLVHVWDTNSLRAEFQLQGFDLAHCLAFSPDDRFLALGGRSEYLLVWDLESREEMHRLKHEGGIGAATFLADGETLIASDIGGIHVWNVRTGEQITSFAEGDDHIIFDLAVSPDGKFLATAGQDRTVRLWNIADQTLVKTFTGHNDEVHAVAFSPDGSMLASAGADLVIRLWNVHTGEQTAQFASGASVVLALAFLEDGLTLASTGPDNLVRLWDVRTQRLDAELRGHGGLVSCLAVHPSGKTLASGSIDHHVRFWDVSSLSGTSWDSLPNRMLALGSSPNGDQLILGTKDGGTEAPFHVFTLDLQSRAILTRQDIGQYRPLALTEDGTLLAATDLGGDVLLWDRRAAKQVQLLNGHDERVRWACFSPDGSTLVTSGFDLQLIVWNVETGERHFSRNDLSGVATIAFSSDGNKIASVFGHIGEQYLRLLDAKTSEELASVSLEGNIALWSMAFSDDENIFAAGTSDGSIRLWDASTLKLLRTCSGHAGFVMSLDFSPDGKRLASACQDQTVRLWDTATGEQLASYEDPADWVEWVRFSPDGRTLASVGRSIKLRKAARDDEQQLVDQVSQ